MRNYDESFLDTHPGICVIIGIILTIAAAGGFGIAMSPTGEGQFSGKLIGVSYEGTFFKSCEIEQQVGSTRDASSTLDKELCDVLKSKVGQEITVDYELVKFSWKTDTRYIVRAVK